MVWFLKSHSIKSIKSSDSFNGGKSKKVAGVLKISKVTRVSKVSRVAKVSKASRVSIVSIVAKVSKVSIVAKVKKVKKIIVVLCFLPTVLFSAIRIKTVEYTFGIGAPSGVTSGSTLTYPSIRIRLPDIAGAGVRKAWVELHAFSESGANIDITGVNIYFSSGTSAGTTPRDVIRDGSTVVDGDTDESLRVFFRCDVTPYIGSPLDWTYYTAAVSLTSSAGLLFQNLSLKLYITYEYDDNASIQVNTVRFPLLSASNVASRQTQAPAGTETSFTYKTDIAEASYSGYTLQQQWFEIRGHRMSGAATTDGSISGWISGNVALSTMTLDGSQIDSYDFFYIISTGAVSVPGFLENTNQTLIVKNVTNAVYVLGGEVVLTYEFSKDAPTKTKTIRYFLGQGSSAGVTTATQFEIPLYIEETLATNGIKAFYTEVNTSYNGTTEGTVSFEYSVNNVSDTVQTYSLNTQAAQISGHIFFVDLFSSNPNANYVYGAPVKFRYIPGTNAANLGSLGAQLVITYQYTSSAKFTEFYQTMTGQAVHGVIVSTGFPFNVWFPDPDTPVGRKQKRSFYTLIEFCQNAAANTTTANPSTTQNTSGLSAQTAAHRSTTENFFNVMISTSAHSVLDVSSTSAVHNMSISVNNALFTGKCFITYSYFPAPSSPTALAQYKADGQTAISTGSWVNSTSVVLKIKVIANENGPKIL